MFMKEDQMEVAPSMQMLTANLTGDAATEGNVCPGMRGTVFRHWDQYSLFKLKRNAKMVRIRTLCA